MAMIYVNVFVSTKFTESFVFKNQLFDESHKFDMDFCMHSVCLLHLLFIFCTLMKSNFKILSKKTNQGSSI